jgi:AraC-like DNA-binding protein
LSKIARGLDGLDCLHAGRIRTDGAWRMEAHSHPIHELLLTTGLPLKAIAPRCGLADVYTLSRLFHKQFGASPSAFRARAPNRSARKDRRRAVPFARQTRDP